MVKKPPIKAFVTHRHTEIIAQRYRFDLIVPVSTAPDLDHDHALDPTPSPTRVLHPTPRSISVPVLALDSAARPTFDSTPLPVTVPIFTKLGCLVYLNYAAAVHAGRPRDTHATRLNDINIALHDTANVIPVLDDVTATNFMTSNYYHGAFKFTPRC
ncbi:hypothetical protein EVAR_63952_1 [Eumeta japonica]|uniref:Uncharacterized protein n=1 Tax=Eumeta variegata TaxID=151549 RepID=A0A4C1ZXE9_EUMVA|nr:hypothetical protein EVAR_63952_1 [Eumeta japonica]